MRRMILYLLTLFLLVVSILSVVKGITIGNIEIDNYKTISEENDALDKLISDATTQKESKYSNAISLQQTAYNNLTKEKESYQQLLNLGVDENGIPLSKIQEYEIEKIWITLGNYAKEEGVELKIDVTVNNSVAKTYDLNFTVVGDYIQIADFLYDIQRDGTLVFKIEEFNLVLTDQTTEESNTSIDSTDYTDSTVETESTETVVSYDLTATFVCKDIRLNITDADSASSSDDTETTDDATNEDGSEATDESGTAAETSGESE